MGNSLLRNRGNSFDDMTVAAGVGMGRWAWSSDAFDFDHDGFLDLYIANGMVSGPFATRPQQFLLAAGGGHVSRRGERVS